MKVDLNKDDLIALVRGSEPSFSEFSNPLVIKGGHFYSDQYGRTTWSNLQDLTEDELWRLYQICKKS